MFWCWLQELLCSCADIVPSDDPSSTSSSLVAAQDDNQQKSTPFRPESDATTTSPDTTNESSPDNALCYPPNPSAMFQTIAALIDIAIVADENQLDYSSSTSNATNTKTRANSIEEIDNYNNYFKTVGIHFQKTPNLQLQHAERVDHQNEYNLIDDFDNEFIDHNNDAAFLNNQISSCNSELSADTNDTDTHYNDNNHQRTNDIYNFNHNNNNNNNNRNISNINHNRNGNNNNNSKIDFDDFPITHVRHSLRKAPNTLDLVLSNTTTVHNASGSSVRPIANNTLALKKRKRNLNQTVNTKYSDQFQLNGIVEECEYDSDIGKFNCKINNEQITSDNSSGSIDYPIDNIYENSCDERNAINDLNVISKQRNSLSYDMANEQFNINQTMDGTEKIVMKRIEFFESGHDGKVVNTVMGTDECDNAVNELNTEKSNKNDEDITQISTILCLTTFMLVVTILYFFPLPS